MKLWLLERNDTFDDPDGLFSFDTYQSFVVLSESEQKARELACDYDDSSVPSKQHWLNPQMVKCEAIPLETEGVVHSHYLNG